MKEMSLEELWQLYPIILKDHNPNYQSWYAEKKQRLLHILHNYDICRINHIGSTSVEGLIAKPTIDILLELPKDYAVNDIAQLLQNDDWILMQKDDKQRTLRSGKRIYAQRLCRKGIPSSCETVGRLERTLF